MTEIWDQEAIRCALMGDVEALIDAFNWRSSPQGWSYWNSRVQKGSSMSKEDRKYLESLLKMENSYEQ